MNKIIYISGKITGDENYIKKFAEAEKILTEKSPLKRCFFKSEAESKHKRFISNGDKLISFLQF